MMQSRRTNPRAEFRLRQNQRINDSVSLAEKFPRLKSLKVHLTFFDAEKLKKSKELKYTVNVEHAKSMFYFGCPGECIDGDFDLSEDLAKAVAGKRKVASGELRCQGKRKKPSREEVPCNIVLKYKLTLNYV